MLSCETAKWRSERFASCSSPLPPPLLLASALQTRQPLSFLVVDLKQRLLLPPSEALQVGCRYDVPLINSLILYVGMQVS